MFDTIAGLPVHVLIIHAVVVLAPLTALLAIWYAVRPASRASLRWPLAAGAIVTGIAGLIAGASGEALEERVRAADSGNAAALALVHEHAEAGDLARVLCVALMIAALAALVVLPGRGRPRVRGLLATGTAAVLVLAAVAATGSVLVTGHTGAKAAWAAEVAATNGASANAAAEHVSTRR